MMSAGSGETLLKVLFVLPNLAPGGAERVLIGLMNGLDRGRFKPVLVVFERKGPLEGLLDRDIEVIALGQRRVWLAPFRLWLVLRRVRPDIVASTMAHINFTVLLLRPFFPRMRFAVREAITPSFLLARHTLLAPVIRLLYRKLYPRADLVISPAQIILRELAGPMGLRLKAPVCLPNPVDEDKLRALGVVSDFPPGLRFVAAGRLHYQKGFDRLIVALKGFDPGVNWTLKILGAGGERPALQALINENDLRKHILLCGHADNPWPVYAAADAFLLPSRWEGLPNVALEALACGTPVIAMDEAGGIEEIAALAAAGSVRIVGDMGAFAAAMRTVEPAEVQAIRASLLPACYRYAEVERRFADLLRGLAQA